MSQTVVLITGGNRGLGRGLVESFLTLPNHTVIAANRDPSHPTSKSLADLPRAKDSGLIVVKCDAAVEQDPWDAVSDLEENYGIKHLDIVVANAAIFKENGLVKDVKRADMREHNEVNPFGTVSLYQATRDLLQKSSREPVFAPVGSLGGSVSKDNVPNACYGASKAMVHWYGTRINSEDEWLNCFVLDTGFSRTDMGAHVARTYGFPDEFGAEPKVVTDGMFEVLRNTSKEKHGGKLVRYCGEILDW